MPSEQPREGTRAEGLVPTESLREAIEQCREMEDPHRYHMLCAKIMSRISCATAPEEPAQPQPRGEGDDLAARLEEKARAESDEFGNYHDRYAEGPALPEPPRIESAPARVDPSEVADTRTIEQKLEDWAHDLAHSRVFNGAAPVCREAAALIADLRQTCADQGAAYHALAERLAERSNRDFVACTAAGAEGVRMGVALAEATSGSCTCGRLQLVPEQHKPECPVYRPAQTAPPEQSGRVDGCQHDSTRVDGWLDDCCLRCGASGYFKDGHYVDPTGKQTKGHPSGKTLIWPERPRGEEARAYERELDRINAELRRGVPIDDLLGPAPPREEEAGVNPFNDTTGEGSPLTAGLFRRTVDQVGNLDARREAAPPRGEGEWRSDEEAQALIDAIKGEPAPEGEGEAS